MSRKQINDCLDAIFGSCNANLFKANYLASFGLLSQAEDIMNLFGISDPIFIYLSSASCDSRKRQYGHRG